MLELGEDTGGAVVTGGLAGGGQPRLAELLAPAAPARSVPPEAGAHPADRFRDILTRILSGLLTPELPPV